MTEIDAKVSRMLNNYRDIIHDFITGEMSADDFESNYLSRFKADADQVTGHEFDILDELFADVDDYVSDPELRQQVSGLDAQELRVRASSAYARLFGDPPSA